MTRDEGSISIEYAMFTPVIFLVLALLYLYGRVVITDGNLDSATRDAARVASQAPSYDQAATAAQKVLDAQFAKVKCIDSTDGGGPKMTLGPDPFTPGATVTVTASCEFSVSDIGIPGLPGTLTAHSTFSSLIDPNRTLG